MNRLTRYTLTCCGFTILVVTLAIWPALPLNAQVKAAFVENVDESGRIPYQAAAGTLVDCFGNSSCNIDFPAVPTGKRLVATNLSAIFTVTTGSPGQLLLVTLQRADRSCFITTYPCAVVPALFQGTVATQDAFVVNAAIRMYFDGGVTPRVELDIGTASGRTVLFKLSGYLVDCASSACAAILP
jgi:hypothetical protein